MIGIYTLYNTYVLGAVVASERELFIIAEIYRSLLTLFCEQFVVKIHAFFICFIQLKALFIELLL